MKGKNPAIVLTGVFGALTILLMLIFGLIK